MISEERIASVRQCLNAGIGIPYDLTRDLVADRDQLIERIEKLRAGLLAQYGSISANVLSEDDARAIANTGRK